MWRSVGGPQKDHISIDDIKRCIIESHDRPALVACCCEKVWPEGATYDIYGGKACFLCLNGRCPRTLIERIADLDAREEAPDL